MSNQNLLVVMYVSLVPTKEWKIETVERKVKRNNDKRERMKDDGEVKSDGGNVKKASLFYFLLVFAVRMAEGYECRE